MTMQVHEFPTRNTLKIILQQMDFTDLIFDINHNLTYL